jgi:leucyl aminopeptidase
MDYSVKKGRPEEQKTECFIVGAYSDKKLTPSAEILDKKSEGLISKLVKRGDITGKIGDTVMIQEASKITPERILVVGCGKKGLTSGEEFIKIANSAAEAIKRSRPKNALTALTEIDTSEAEGMQWKITQLVQSIERSTYKYENFKQKKSKAKFSRLNFLVEAPLFGSAKNALRTAKALASGISLTKDLGNCPSNICNPTYLAEAALDLGKKHEPLKVSVLEEPEMNKLGMGSLMSVTQGSRQPAKLIVMQYQGAPSESKPIVLIGKGVTFDSGGISLKPGAGMDEMKYDMCGAATVVGVTAALAEMSASVNFVGIIPAVENMPDGAASRPGDIVTSMSGKTIEILNTDAEGRLILCDALTYCEKFDPEVVIDIATLTGACIVALGSQASGLMSNDDRLADDLLAAGQRCGDKAWRLPIWDGYQKQIDSPFADMANVGGRAAGTITAACFLARFAENYRWAHLDIAGTAWVSGKNKSASGRPVPLLVEYIMHRAALLS